MVQVLLNANHSAEEDVEFRIIQMLRPEFNYICSNSVRACILHLLIKSRELNHTIQVEEIANKIGKRHSLVIYHLEQMKGWNLVDVVKSYKYGNKNKRSIWGLNLKYPNLIALLYGHVIKIFYTQRELEKLCNVNRNERSKSG